MVEHNQVQPDALLLQRCQGFGQPVQGLADLVEHRGTVDGGVQTRVIAEPAVEFVAAGNHVGLFG